MNQKTARRTIEITSLINLTEAQMSAIKGGNERIRISTFSRGNASQVSPEQWQKTEVLLAAGDFLPTRDMAPKLKWIHITFAGVDPILDQPIIHDKDIKVTSSSGVMVSQMGEYVLMAILMLGHKMPAINAAQARNEWISNKSGMVIPKELRGSTVGIVGYGSIGTQLSVLAESLGMKVIYHDVVTKLPLGNATQVGSLEELLGKADVVTLHVPDLPSTRNMITATELAAMKPGAHLINAARGKCVDIDALAAALESILHARIGCFLR